MATFTHHLSAAVGDSKINQDIADAGLEIALAETPEELLAAATRYQNFALIAARGNAMNQASRVSAMIARMRSGVAV